MGYRESSPAESLAAIVDLSPVEVEVADTVVFVFLLIQLLSHT